MPDWLRTSVANEWGPPPALLLWRICAAFALGVGVAGIYRWARRRETIAPTFLTTLVLLATLIAVATQIIGDNVARAFSLVGALSVVRFRTVVRDTQDTAFVIFAVVVGMAAGANHLVAGVVGLGVLAVAAPILWPPLRRSAWQACSSELTVRMKQAAGLQANVESVIGISSDRVDLIATSTARQGTSVDVTYRIRLRPGVTPGDLVSGLRMVDGVEGVELKREE